MLINKPLEGTTDRFILESRFILYTVHLDNLVREIQDVKQNIRIILDELRSRVPEREDK